MNEYTHIEYIIVQYLNGSITKDEHCELSSWLALSDENQRVFDQMREIWLASEMNSEKFHFDFQAAFEQFKMKTAQRKPIPRFRKPKPRRVITLSYRWAAALVLLAVVGGGMLYRWIQPKIEEPVVLAYQEITVPYGARSKMLLPDGSRITLNAGSTLRYNVDFGRNRRDLWLDGEGYFVVSKSQTPFVVHSGDVQIKALGTQFNVRAYSSEKTIETTLVEGKVAISQASEQPGQSGEVTLLPNQKLIVTKDRKQEKVMSPAQPTDQEQVAQAAQPATIPVNNILKEEKVDPLPDISWKDNEWVIYRENLENLAVKLERRFDIKIVFRDEHLKTLRYNGTLPDESLEQVLNAMCIVSPIQYSVKGKTVVFSEDKLWKNKLRAKTN